MKTSFYYGESNNGLSFVPLMHFFHCKGLQFNVYINLVGCLGVLQNQLDPGGNSAEILKLGVRIFQMRTPSLPNFWAHEVLYSDAIFSNTPQGLKFRKKDSDKKVYLIRQLTYVVKYDQSLVHTQSKQS